MPRFYVAVFCEHEFDEVYYGFVSLQVARAWADGFGVGCSKYGGGSHGAYLLDDPKDVQEMRECESVDEIEVMYKRYAKLLDGDV